MTGPRDVFCTSRLAAYQPIGTRIPAVAEIADRSYFSLLQIYLLYDVGYSHRPLSGIAMFSMLSMDGPDVKIFGVKGLR